MTAFIHKPFPLVREPRKDLVSYFFIGVFVALFLILFQPFDINLWQTEHKTLKLSGFGLISFVMPTLFSFAMRFVSKRFRLEERWTILHEMGMMLLVLVFIALGNLFYGMLLGTMALSLGHFMTALFFTCVIGIFPVGFYVMSKHNQLLKINLAHSMELNAKLGRPAQQPAPTAESPTPESLVLTAENGRDSIRLLDSQLLYIESADNYSTVVFTEAGENKKLLLRSSLKRIETQLAHPAITRCHRAYIVNLGRVKNVEGNAAGYRLFFNEDGYEPVPVSRNYVAAVSEKLKSLG